MGCCQTNERHRDEEYAKLMAGKYTKYTEENARKIGPRMRRSHTRADTFLLQIGLIGEIEMYEKRCWLLRLLDGDEFDTEKHTQIEELNKNHMSQCNKNFSINNGNYCAQISILSEMIFEDNATNSNEYNAFVLYYDVTKLESFNKLRAYLDKMTHGNIAIMGIIPSCNVNIDPLAHRQVATDLAMELCATYALKNVMFIGETNAKTGENVSTSIRKVIQKCIETQQVNHEKDFISLESPKTLK